MDDKFINLAKKLKKLAESGVGGEKDNAQQKLQLIMEKYGITLADIDGDERKDYVAHFNKEIPYRFIRQVLASIIGNISKSDSSISQFKRVRKRNHISYHIENIEPQYFTEFVIKVQTYWADYQKQMETFYSAYVQKNKLYTKPDENQDGDEERKPLTPEERLELYKMYSMMEGIERVQYQKRLQ